MKQHIHHHGHRRQGLPPAIHAAKRERELGLSQELLQTLFTYDDANRECPLTPRFPLVASIDSSASAVYVPAVPAIKVRL
ncbi:MAG: hypothetical protein EOM17_15820, partial [Synergistales bacterium]|nr:hypothetical protein [Synergistales bacterium]